MKRTIQRIPVVTLLAVFLFVVMGIMPAMAALTSDTARYAPSSGTGTATSTDTATATATSTDTATATATSTDTATATATCAPSSPSSVGSGGCTPTATATSTVTATATCTPSSPNSVVPGGCTPTATKTATATATCEPSARSTGASDCTPTATATRPAEIHVRGTVKEVITGSVTIDDMTFQTDANTKYEPNAAAVVVGAYVEVEGYKLPGEGTILLAKEISVEHAPGAEVEKIEFRGPILSFSDTQWVVAGKTLSITAQTVISGTPAVGAIAEVKASRLSDGTLVALKIKVESAKHETERVEFKGIISAFSDTQWTVGGKNVIVDANTVISGTPQIGLMAEVRAIKSGAILTATKIVVQKPEPQKVEFKGTITAINGNTWTIGGKTVTVDAQTMIDESHGAAKVGATVEVLGSMMGDGSVRAIRIQVERSK
ncbi:MAG: hypothetical protein HZB53_13480 [Chloroflexi bacterium]|nr:hypothetical protein [Chloroflexota bacterium]